MHGPTLPRSLAGYLFRYVTFQGWKYGLKNKLKRPPIHGGLLFLGLIPMLHYMCGYIIKNEILPPRILYSRLSCLRRVVLSCALRK